MVLGVEADGSTCTHPIGGRANMQNIPQTLRPGNTARRNSTDPVSISRPNGHNMRFVDWAQVHALAMQGWFCIRVGDRIAAHYGDVQEGTS